MTHMSNGEIWSVAPACGAAWHCKITTIWRWVTCKRCLKMKKPDRRRAAADEGGKK